MMVGYKVHIQDNEVVIELKESGFKMRVFTAENEALKDERAILEATQYIEKTSFIPWSNYMFEAIEYKTLEQLDLNIFKSAIAFYFNSVLGTDLFVISVPRASLLCPIEHKMYVYDKKSA
jgi:hypothetical protein